VQLGSEIPFPILQLLWTSGHRVLRGKKEGAASMKHRPIWFSRLLCR
jgi:hypothetical protein